MKDRINRTLYIIKYTKIVFGDKVKNIIAFGFFLDYRFFEKIIMTKYDKK